MREPRRRMQVVSTRRLLPQCVGAFSGVPVAHSFLQDVRTWGLTHFGFGATIRTATFQTF